MKDSIHYQRFESIKQHNHVKEQHNDEQQSSEQRNYKRAAVEDIQERYFIHTRSIHKKIMTIKLNPLVREL